MGIVLVRIDVHSVWLFIFCRSEILVIGLVEKACGITIQDFGVVRVTGCNRIVETSATVDGIVEVAKSGNGPVSGRRVVCAGDWCGAEPTAR